MTEMLEVQEEEVRERWMRKRRKQGGYTRNVGGEKKKREEDKDICITEETQTITTKTTTTTTTPSHLLWVPGVRNVPVHGYLIGHHHVDAIFTH